MSITIPFSYYLYHMPTGLKYYGVRYSKGCSPKDIWTTYFTSSLKVKQLISEYGLNSFKIEVRKTFRSGADALLWEHKVLRRLNAASSNIWINKQNGDRKFRAPLDRQWWCKGEKEKLCVERPGPDWTLGRILKTTLNKKWYNNGKRSMMLDYCPPGWNEGMLQSHKENCSKPGIKWWNNGVEQVKSYNCPLGWKPGPLPNFGNKKGRKWYNNGSDQICVHTRPSDPLWVIGRLR